MGGTYVADTHAFAYYLAGKLPEKVDSLFREAERERCRIVIPSIAVAELIYILEKGGVEEKIWEMLDKIDTYPSFQLYPLDEDVLRMIPEVRLSELHDRIIVATSLLLKAEGLVTNDSEIRKSRLVETFW
jgi:predicted nucleic acid-binding protein